MQFEIQDKRVPLGVFPDVLYISSPDQYCKVQLLRVSLTCCQELLVRRWLGSAGLAGHAALQSAPSLQVSTLQTSSRSRWCVHTVSNV